MRPWPRQIEQLHVPSVNGLPRRLCSSDSLISAQAFFPPASDGGNGTGRSHRDISSGAAGSRIRPTKRLPYASSAESSNHFPHPLHKCNFQCKPPIHTALKAPSVLI